MIADTAGRVSLFDARPWRAALVVQLGAAEVAHQAAIVTDPTSVRYGSGFCGRGLAAGHVRVGRR